jgi:hypothetical protein
MSTTHKMMTRKIYKIKKLMINKMGRGDREKNQIIENAIRQLSNIPDRGNKDFYKMVIDHLTEFNKHSWSKLSSEDKTIIKEYLVYVTNILKVINTKTGAIPIGNYKTAMAKLYSQFVNLRGDTRAA